MRGLLATQQSSRPHGGDPIPTLGGPIPMGGSRRGVLSPLSPQVTEEGGQPLGTLSLPLSRLLAAEGLVLDGWFPLAGGGPHSQVLLRAQLGVSAGGGGGGDPGTLLTPLSPHPALSPPGAGVTAGGAGGGQRRPGRGGRCPPTHGGAGGRGERGGGAAAAPAPA